jgi:Putative metal-binding motif
VTPSGARGRGLPGASTSTGHFGGVEALAALALVLAGCGTNPPAELIVHFDSGSDVASDVAVPDAGAVSADASPYLGAPCVDDGQCDDGLACTYDSCDTSAGRCLNVPDDTQCQDGVYCDGEELCVPGHGCEPGPVVSCDNGDDCQIATCVEATRSCQYTERDVDQDGDPDAHCAPGHDCDDLNPDVSSLHAEVCANGIDDNCNGLIDESPCVSPQGTTCAGAVPIAGPGNYLVSTVGANKAFTTSCSVTAPAAGQTVVAAITIPPGGNVDLEVWASSASTEVAVALDGACGDATSELGCGSGAGATDVRARARNVAPGVYFAVVTTQSPGPVELMVGLLPPTSPPVDVDCPSAIPVQAGASTAVTLVGAPTDLASACPSSDGELTYSFTLTDPEDVRVYASTVKGSGMPVVGLRAPPCTDAADELECATAGPTPLYERSLSAGTYVITVGSTSPIDATFEVELSPPTPVPSDQTCASPPAILASQTVDYDLSSHENAIKDGCLATGPDAAYDLSLAAASDVLLIDRFPETETGAVSLDQTTCDAAGNLACDTEGTPARVGKRNVAAGDYRVVVADQLGLQGTVQALVRPTVAPTIIPAGGADTCAQAVDASGGGFFTGDTSTANADYGEGCDAPNQPAGSARDQVLALNLTQPERVVLDMEGSSYTTILEVTQGPGCPGTPVLDACYVGFGAQKSFLDLELGEGQYWIVVDGYGGAAGAWSLDVRVLPPS